MEEMTVEDITKEVQQLRKSLNDADAKIEVWSQNLETLKSEYEELKTKCKDEYDCNPQELEELLQKTKKQAEKLLSEALKEYESLVNEDGTN